jgi:hypothetical protein
MVRIALAVAVATLWVPLPSTAQSPEPLPPALSGRYSVVPPGGRTFVEFWSMRFTEAAGKVRGSVTWRGRGCGAQDEPIEGTWDGSELKLQFVARPNVNVQVPNATYCGEGRTDVVLRRKPGSRDFVGEARLNNAGPVVDVTGSP